MWRRHLAKACVLLTVFSILLGCETQDNTFEFHCPRCDEHITWNAYGDFVFGEVGDDATARKLVSQCGWTVQGGHDGGVGDTLQVTSCGAEGVVLVWAFNSLHAVKLAKGWGGSTERGIRLGNSVGALLAAYPNFKRVSAVSYLLSEDDVEVEAHFNAQGALEALIVGDFFRP